MDVDSARAQAAHEVAVAVSRVRVATVELVDGACGVAGGWDARVSGAQYPYPSGRRQLARKPFLDLAACGVDGRGPILRGVAGFADLVHCGAERGCGLGDFVPVDEDDAPYEVIH